MRCCPRYTGLIAAVLLTVLWCPANGEDSTARPLSVSGYLEAYYCYDSGEPSDHERAPFFYNYSRHGEVALNIGFIKAAYQKAQVRANLALMAGTYPQYNLAAEPLALRHVLEANAGLKISKKHDLWIDAGIMPAHIGFESAVGQDCWTLTRSILADNSPYYEAGVRLAYTSRSAKWYLSALYLNGWQRIQRSPGNNTPAFGTQLTYTPSDKLSLNWSTYVGNEYPDSIRRWRYFNNMYARFGMTERLGFIVGFDVGMEQMGGKAEGHNVWYAPVLIGRYILTEKFRLALRGEYYGDEARVIVTEGPGPHFSTGGFSLNVDYLPRPNMVLRLEGRHLVSKYGEFTFNGSPASWNYFLTGSCSVSF